MNELKNYINSRIKHFRSLNNKTDANYIDYMQWIDKIWRELEHTSESAGSELQVAQLYHGLRCVEQLRSNCKDPLNPLVATKWAEHLEIELKDRLDEIKKQLCIFKEKIHENYHNRAETAINDSFKILKKQAELAGLPPSPSNSPNASPSTGPSASPTDVNYLIDGADILQSFGGSTNILDMGSASSDYKKWQEEKISHDAENIALSKLEPLAKKIESFESSFATNSEPIYFRYQTACSFLVTSLVTLKQITKEIAPDL